MAGIYVHIPFCRQKCHYCNFHFSVSLKNKRALLASLLKEIDLRSEFLGRNEITTLYLGGGTPSVLTVKEILILKDKIASYFEFNEGMEFTIEANPDDLNESYLQELKDIGVNRLSVGIQSFNDEELKLMNRSHDAFRARQALQNIKSVGFDDYSIDLIFGMPASSLESWKKNLEEGLAYEAPHYSLYNLTVEPRTALDHMVGKGSIQMLPDEVTAKQFQMSMDYMHQAGYEHYEISNYAKAGRYAKHNTSYWQGETYMGIGPSAHSYKGETRSWNVANNNRYIKMIETNVLPEETEILSIEDQYNEYIMTGLRTMWGVDPQHIKAFGEKFYLYFNSLKEEFIRNEKLSLKQAKYVLTKKGKLFADQVASDLFWAE